MRHRTSTFSASRSEQELGQGSLELTEELIRLRAYHYYEERGCEDGHDLDDWFRAEAEITGKKPVAEAEGKSMTAVA